MKLRAVDLIVFKTSFLLLCLCGHSAHAQYFNESAEFIKANSVWVFGDSVGIDFNGTTPVIIQTHINVTEGGSSVADPQTGKLLFYSDGRQLWNRNNQVMPNGDGLFGNVGGSTIQAVCIVPVIGSDHEYYVFSLNGPSSLGPHPPPLYNFNGSLHYSVVDMDLDNGLGDVIAGQKNINLSNDSLSESMIAIPGCSNDIWLMVHLTGYAVFKAYHITAQGINTSPVVSAVGQIQAGFSTLTGSYYQGSLAVTSDRTHIAISGWPISYAASLTGVIVCEFDPATGKVSNSILVNGHQATYGLAFSPDDTKLYMACPAGSSTQPYGPHNLVQYDISSFDSATIAASKVIVADSFATGISYLRQYNGKIYISSLQQRYALHTINQPNLKGTACDYEDTVIVIGPPGGGRATLPTDVVFPIIVDSTPNSVTDSLLCTVDGGRFQETTVKAPPGFAHYQWDDGSTEATRLIKEPGTYWVTCSDVCNYSIDTFIFRHVDIPSFSLGQDTFLCRSPFLILKAPEISDAGYLWQDGTTHSMDTAREDGAYWVKVSKGGCFLSDTIRVKVADFSQDLGDDAVLCAGPDVQLILKANVPPGGKAQWSTGSEDTSITVKDTGVYWITVKDILCTGSDTIKIGSAICECSFEIPNAFSPNHDGKNDIFAPVIKYGCPVSKFSFSIYNRYGQRVYMSSNPQEGWDGTYNGRPADVGTYFYTLYFEGGTKEISYDKAGDIALIR